MRLRKALVLAVIAALGVTASGLWIASDSRKSIDQLTYDDYLAAKGRSGGQEVREGGGIAARASDPANAGIRSAEGGWLVDGYTAAVEMAEDPLDLDMLAQADAEKWKATQAWKLSHGGASDFGLARQHCVVRELKGRLGDAPCENNLSVVVRRTSASDGEVVFVSPRLSDAASDACRRYSECLAKTGWLKRVAPLPPGSEEYFAFRAGDVIIPFEGTEEERMQLLTKQVEGMKTQLLAWKERADPELDSNIALLEDMLGYYEWLLKESS